MCLLEKAAHEPQACDSLMSRIISWSREAHNMLDVAGGGSTHSLDAAVRSAARLGRIDASLARRLRALRHCTQVSLARLLESLREVVSCAGQVQHFVLTGGSEALGEENFCPSVDACEQDAGDEPQEGGDGFDGFVGIGKRAGDNPTTTTRSGCFMALCLRRCWTFLAMIGGDGLQGRA